MKRDDIIEYSLDNHHSEEEGAEIRKSIIKVTVILTSITIAEVLMGIFSMGWMGLKWEIIKYFFISLTIVKAGYIVLRFMHLGDERKTLKWTILGPYLLFISYLIFIALTEGIALHHMRQLFHGFWL